MYSTGLTQVFSAVQLRVYDDAQLQVHYALQLQVYFAKNDNLQASPAIFDFTRRNEKTVAHVVAYRFAFASHRRKALLAACVLRSSSILNWNPVSSPWRTANSCRSTSRFTARS